MLLGHLVVSEGFRIIQRSNNRGMAHFLHHNHGGILVQRLVDRHHLAELHQMLDDFRRLDRHLVGQLGHGDGFGHMNFNHACFHGCGLGVVVIAVIAVIAAALATWTGTPIVATAARCAGGATGRDRFLLGWIAGPTAGELGGFDFLASAWCGCRTWCACGIGSNRFRGCRASSGFVQSAFESDGRIRFFNRGWGWRLLCRCRHHQTDRCRLSFRQAPAIPKINCTRRIFRRALLGIRRRLITLLRLLLGQQIGLFRCSGHLCRRNFSRIGRLLFGYARALLFQSRLRRSLLCSLACRQLSRLARTLFLLLSLASALGEFFLLPANQFSLATRLFFTARQFGIADQRRRLDHFVFWLRRLCRYLNPVLTPYKRSLLAHFNLDRARLARGIGLLDFAGRFFDQRNFLALRAGGAMAGLQKAEQTLLVRFGQIVRSD